MSGDAKKGRPILRIGSAEGRIGINDFPFEERKTLADRIAGVRPQVTHLIEASSVPRTACCGRPWGDLPRADCLIASPALATCPGLVAAASPTPEDRSQK